MLRIFPLGFALIAGISSQALAQTPPPPTYDAGALMRQTEQMLRPNTANKPQREALAPPMVITETTQIEVKRIKFLGNRHLISDQLQTLAAPFENRTLGATDLMHLTHAVSEAYRQTGWVVNVYVPRQRLSGGDLTLQVIETLPPSR